MLVLLLHLSYYCCLRLKVMYVCVVCVCVCDVIANINCTEIVLMSLKSYREKKL